MNLTLAQEDKQEIALLIVDALTTGTLQEIIDERLRTQKQEDQRGMSSRAAAVYLGCTDEALRASRSTGKLWGTTAPPWRDSGTRVAYLRERLDEWLDALPEKNWQNAQQGKRKKKKKGVFIR